MPTYDYACLAPGCDYKFEAMQSIMADPFVKCPACNQDSLKRLLGKGAGIVFKGTGFYQTDYKSPKKDGAS
jgi:putative FmdB family regulatory protein